MKRARAREQRVRRRLARSREILDESSLMILGCESRLTQNTRGDDWILPNPPRESIAGFPSKSRGRVRDGGKYRE